MNDDQAIEDIRRKIEREKNIINAANSMRAKTDNEGVRSKCDTQMREARRNLKFFEDRLRDIQMRKLGKGVGNMSVDGQAPPPPPKDSSGGAGHYGDGQGNLMAPGQAYPSPAAKGKPNFSKLGM